MRKFILCASLLFASVLSFAAQTAGAAKSNSATSAAENQDATTPRAVVTTPTVGGYYYIKTQDGQYLGSNQDNNLVLSTAKQAWKYISFQYKSGRGTKTGYTFQTTSLSGATQIINKYTINEKATTTDVPSEYDITFHYGLSFVELDAQQGYVIMSNDEKVVLATEGNNVYYDDYENGSRDLAFVVVEEYESPTYTIKINEVNYQTDITTNHIPGDNKTYQTIIDALPENVKAIGGTITIKNGDKIVNISDTIADDAVITVNVEYSMNIENGKYYRFYNPNTNEYIYDNGSQLVATSTADATDQRQIFQFNGTNENGFTLKNLATGSGINKMSAGEAVTTGASDVSLNYGNNTLTGLFNFINSNGFALLSQAGKIIAGPANMKESSWILQPVEVITYTVSTSIILPGKEAITEELTVLPGTKYTFAINDEHVKSLLNHYVYTITVNGTSSSNKLGDQIEINNATTIAIEFTGLNVQPTAGNYYNIFNESNGLYVTQTAAGAPLTVATSNQTYAQTWKLEDAGNNQVYIMNALTGEYVQSAGDGAITLGMSKVAYTINAVGNIAGADIASGKSWNVNNGSVTGGNVSNSWLFVAQNITDDNVVSMRNYQNIILLPSQLSYIKTISSAAQVTFDGFSGEASSILDGSKNTTIAPTTASFFPSIIFDLGAEVEDFCVTFTASVAARYQISAGKTVGNPIFTKDYDAVSAANTLYTLTENLNNTPVRYVRIRFLDKPEGFNVVEARVNGVINSGNVPCELGQAVINAATISGTYDQENSAYNATAVTQLTNAINAAKNFVSTRETFTTELNRVGGYINRNYTIGTSVGEYTNESTIDVKDDYNNTYNTDLYKKVQYGVTVNNYTEAISNLQASVQPTINMPVNGKAYKLSPESNSDIAATLNHGLPMKNSSDDESNMIFYYNGHTLQAIGNGESLTLNNNSELTFTESPVKLGAFTINAGDYYMYKAATSWAAQLTSEIQSGLENPNFAWKLTEVKEHTVSLRKVDETQAWATFFSSKRCYLQEGVTARYVSSDAEFVKVPGQAGSYYISFVDIEGNILPAATGVILKSATAGDITIYEGDVTTDSTTPENNAFFGFDEDTTVSESQSALALGMVNGIAGFYTFAGDTYWMNKAFLSKNKLNIPTSSAANVSLIWNQSTPTGIDQTVTSDTETEDNAYYDLSGKRYDSKPTKAGIYIKNRKKIIIK